MFYMSPDRDAYLQVTSVNSPLPLTIDRVLEGTTVPMWDVRFPGYAKVSEDELGKMTAMIVFTCNDGKAKMFEEVTLAPPQVWQVTCMARPEEFAAWESQFDEILASFEIK